MNHQAFSLVFDYSPTNIKKILAPLITEFPLDLSTVKLTFDELKEVKAEILGIYFNHFIVPISNNVKHIAGEGVTLNKLPNRLETLKLKASYLEVFAVPLTLKVLELEDVTTNLIHFSTVDYIYLNNIDFTIPINSLEIDAKQISLEHMNTIINAKLRAETVILVNTTNKERDLQYEIECRNLEFYNVNDIEMKNVSCREFQATKSVMNFLPKNAEIIDLSECFVGKYEPTNSIRSFIYTGDFSVEIEYPESLKMCKINNVTMFPRH